MTILSLLARQWSIHLLHATWQSTIVVLLILALVRCIPRASSRLRYALLLIALAKFALPPMLPLPVGVFSAAPPAGGPVMWIIERVVVMSPSIIVAGMILHLAGFTAGLVLIAIRRVQLRRMIAQATPAGSDLVSLLEELSPKFGVDAPAIVLSERARGPFVAGPFPAVIVLPASSPLLRSTDALRDILAHELSHVATYDLHMNWTEAILGAFFWWNPVFHLLIREIRARREERCDDAVLASAVSNSRRYSLSLIETARTLGRDSHPVLGISSHPLHPLAPRVIRLADTSIERRRSLKRAEVTQVLIVALLLLPGVHRATHTQSVPPRLTTQP